ncbi:MAG TPA: discoidin domain-containing protein [Thermoanaerobaculia bacterium]|nr:discoidin domain-containing protein [Thermoanaerobaculia bacterium]
MPNESETISLQQGDLWQGLYRFDTVTMRNAVVVSKDPIETADQTIEGPITTSSIRATNLRIKAGATLTHPAQARLDIVVPGELNIEVGGVINANGLGYLENQTYPGATVPGGNSAGSHMGYGGLYNGPYGSTYGSVYRPAEAGAGARYSGNGGGIVRITAGSLVNDGAISANGTTTGESSAGGSIWITATTVGGTGTIAARGGSGDRSGGGGAIAIEYDTFSGTLLGNVTAYGGTNGAKGGAGTIYLKSGTAVYGDLRIDNGGIVGAPTAMPSLGAGNAQTGSAGAVLVTNRAVNIPAYFVGHWVEVRSAAGTLKGTWRIGTVNAKTMTLLPNAGETVDVEVGDSWQGVYRFDNITLATTKVIGGDPLRSTNPISQGTTVLEINDGAPSFPAAKRSQIIVVSAVTGDKVTGPFGAVTDANGPIQLTVTNTRTAATFTANANADGSFSVPVSGAAGDTFTITATDSHAMPASTTISVNGAVVELNTIVSLTIQPSTVTGGTTVNGSVRLSAPARSTGAVIALSSSAASTASVPATITIAGGNLSAQFPISTSSPASTTDVQISASLGTSTQSATLNVTAAAAALVDLVLASPSVEGGNSVNGTVILGAPAPPGGALVMLASTAPQVSVPQTVLVPEGSTQAAFPVTTARVGADTDATISATWGSTETAPLTLTACTAMTTATPPSSITVARVWIDDALPTGAAGSGVAVFDQTQAASGTKALHFPAATTARSGAMTGAAALAVTAADELVLYALVNPCDPPRQIMVTWSDGTTSWRASWGENRIDPTLAQVQAGAIPRDGAWTRLSVNAKALGITANKNLTALTIAVDGGEAWFDAIGATACAFGRAATPDYLANETVWFDDDVPAGSTINTAFVWDTTQAASGTKSDMVTSTGLGQHYFTNAPQGLKLSADDVIVTYVLLDPCNPPREIMLQFSDSSGFNRRAYWGENLIEFGGINSVERHRFGGLPEPGRWVRLEIPVSSMKMAGTTLTGLAVDVYDGRAWFDRWGKAARVNLAVGKTATHSSTYQDDTVNYQPSRVVDGVFTGVDYEYNHTKNDAQAWWEVDLGSVQPIESIDIWNISNCCQSRMSNYYVLVSDDTFDSKNLTTTLNQDGVTAYYQMQTNDRPTVVSVNRTGRYVRVQLAGTNYLHISEVQVWAPLTPQRVNLAGGRKARQSSTFVNSVGTYMAALAVNGNVIAEAESHTLSQAAPYWEVDLGSIQPISNIDVDNSFSSCCITRMSQFYLYVSDTEMPATNTVADTLNHEGLSAYYRTTGVTSYNFQVNRTGRYVRLQLTGTNYLHPMEVRVWSPSLMIGALAKAPGPVLTSSLAAPHPAGPFDFATAWRRVSGSGP